MTLATSAVIWMDTLLGMKLFIRVFELGSFSKAAAEAHVGQPTVSKQLAQLETRLGARLLHRTTHGLTPTEVGRLYYEKCKLVVQHAEEAQTVAGLLQSELQGSLRISTSLAFGRRVLAPLMMDFMKQHPRLQIDMGFEDRYMDLVEHGIDLAVRMGRLADSSLGARYLGSNPWVVVASPDYLRMRGMLRNPVDLDGHDALVYSSVQGDARWHFSGKYDAGTGDSTDPGDSSRSGIEDGPVGAQPAQHLSVLVKGPLRSNNLSALLAAARAGLGVAALPCYVAQDSISAGAVQPVLTQWSLPTQEVHAVFPSPRHVPAKVQVLIDHLKQGLQAHPAFDT